MIDIPTVILVALLTVGFYFSYKAWEIGEHDDL